jgi:hypothetical protein
MQGRNPLGYADHRPFTGFSDELVYGIKRDGETAHISAVVRGLLCDCRCPACDQTLVAKKGPKQLHHFAHHNKGIACSHVAETNAHIWAKQVLEREKRLTMPPIVAEHGGHTEIVSPAKVYVFAHARLEKRLDTIVPDVVLFTEDGTQLIVEVRVTHACEEAKLTKLRNDGLSSIEIDLRRFRTSTDQTAVEEALLTSAPREWLTNAKQALFDTRLRDRLAAEAARKAKDAEDRARRMAAAEADKARREQEAVARSADRLIRAVQANRRNLRRAPEQMEALLNEFDDAPWSQAPTVGFTVHPLAWQAEIVTAFLTYPNALDYQWADHISTGGALTKISHFLIPAFRGRISEPVRSKLRDEWPCHYVPEEAVERFLDGLAGTGYLWPTRDGEFSVAQEYADRLSERERRRQASQRRCDDVKQRVAVALARLPKAEQGAFDLENWFTTNLRSQNGEPRALCWLGDEAFRNFERALKRVELLTEGGPVTEELLGLPLAGEVTRAQIRERDKLVRAASQRRSSLADAARAELGEEADAWLSNASQDDEEMTWIDQAGLDDLSYQRVRGALAAASAKRQTAIRARNEASSRRSDLREAAAKIYDQDHLEVFLGASHPRLGKSPIDHCVDQRTLRECLALLPRIRRARLR